MPTKHRRIAVTRDPELDRALRETRARLSARETSSASAQVRALAIRGARALGAGSSSDLWRQLERDHGVSPPRRDLLDLGSPEGEPDPARPRPASDALEWVRGER